MLTYELDYEDTSPPLKFTECESTKINASDVKILNVIYEAMRDARIKMPSKIKMLEKEID